jgi:C1A family cysteine protease
MAVPKRELNRHGWIPDLPDIRDKVYDAPGRLLRLVAPLPSTVDLRPVGPSMVFDQGDLGSCTANAIGAAIMFAQINQKEIPVIPSRLFIYYNERVLENSVNVDAGAMLRNGVKSINKQGICPEDVWPYSIPKFASKPIPAAYQAATKEKLVTYSRVTQNTYNPRHCLAAGFPFVFGFSVYESFESQQVATTGIVPMPDPTESQLGGHAVIAVGYDDSRKAFLVRNSWSETWGIAGHFWLPYDYILNPDLADDFWTIRLLS